MSMDANDIEWRCGCGHTNPDFAAVCSGCGGERYPYTEPLGQSHYSSFTPAAWKDARRILKLPDSSIEYLGTRKSGVSDYVIEKVTVSFGHGPKKDVALCNTHRVSKCSHIRRLERFIRERAA